MIRTFGLFLLVLAASLSLRGSPVDPSGSAPRTTSIDFTPMGRAMSPAGQDFRQNIHTTYNGSRAAAIVTYTTLTGGLWAHYYDGSGFSPAVNIVPPGASKTSVIGDRVCTAFINSRTHSCHFTAGRDGDAIIFFTAVDQDSDGPAGPDGDNRALYCAYFDVTYASDPAHNYGFQTSATRISTRDGFDENVICHGLVTDGLIGEARWLNFQYNYKYGDETTGLAVFWTQGENIDGDPAIEDLATYAAFFDLTQVGPTSDPLVPQPEIRIPTANFGASDAGLTADRTRTEARYVVYNNLLIMRCAANSAGLGAEPDLWDFGTAMHNGDDVTLQCAAFNFATRTVAAPTVLAAATPFAGDTIENNAMPLRQDGSFLSGGHSMIGTDEGLSRDVFVFAELSEAQASTTWGTKANNAKLAAVEIDPATGGLFGHAFLSTDDPAITDSVGSTTVDCRLSRNGDYLLVGWLQTRRAGAVDDKALLVSQISTQRSGSVTSALSTRASAPRTVNVDVDGAPVSWFAFEDGLEYVTGGQSHPLVMNIFYEQSGGADDEVWCGRATADLTLSPPVPASSVSMIEAFVEGAQPGMGSINEEHFLFNGTDNGNDGCALAFYVKDVTTDVKARLSLFAETTGPGADSTRIDRPHPFTQVDLQGIPLLMTAAGSDISAVGGAYASTKRPHGWSRVHVFWTEDRTKGLADEGSGLYTRYWDASVSSPTLAGKFVPSMAKKGIGATEPYQLDFEGPPTTIDDQPEIRGLARKGSDACVWFVHRGHVWAQEFQSGKKGMSWEVHGGSGHPNQLDDKVELSPRPRAYHPPGYIEPGSTGQTVGPMKSFFTHPGSGNNLDGAMFFWIKDVLDDGLPQLYCRIHEH